MAVTAVSVMDRLTAPGVHGVESAREALESALDDLAGWVDELGEAVGPKAERSQWTATPKAAHKGISEATGAVLRAAEHMGEALSLLGIEAL